MTTSFELSRNNLLQQTLDFLWRQWTTLGVPGNCAYGGDSIIDPEALLLITTELGRYDARLLDLVIDWLHGEGKNINLQRLQRLQGDWGSTDERVLSGIAGILSEQSVLRKWEKICETFRSSEPDEPLFLSTTGPAALVFGDPDPRFQRYGLLRSRWVPRNACLPPKPDQPGNLLCTLRSLFGVNARAEIMAWLLTHDSGHPAAIARDTGYFSKSIQATLNEMEESGHIRAERAGREKHFRLRRQDWRFLLNLHELDAFPRWIPWPPVYYFIFRTLDLLGKSASQDVSPHLRSIQLRRFLDEVAPKLRESGLRSVMSAERDLTGNQLAEAIVKDVGRLGLLLESDFAEAPNT
jgi:hypothetical protein